MNQVENFDFLDDDLKVDVGEIEKVGFVDNNELL